MERTEDFCFEFKYLRSNRNQLREKKYAKEEKMVYTNNTKVNFKCIKQK